MEGKSTTWEIATLQGRITELERQLAEIKERTYILETIANRSGKKEQYIRHTHPLSFALKNPRPERRGRW